MLDNVVCKYEMMAMEQTIFLPDGSARKVPNKKVAESIVEFCNTYDSYDVYLLGNKNFLQRLSDDIYTCESLKYAANKINVTIGVK